ncbi:MAG TPA: ABC transporter permease subunit [Acidimicrobiia bacterium]
MSSASTALVVAEVRTRYRTLLALGAGALVFELALAGTYTALGGAAGLAQSFGKNQPAFLSAFAGGRGINIFTPSNYVGFGFVHPLFLVLTLTVGISIGTASVAGDIETGRVDLLYARPLHRTTLFDSRLGLWAGAQVMVVVAGLVGSWIGTTLTHDLRGVSPMLLVRIGAAYLPLAAFFGAVAFAASASSHTRGHALAVTVGVASLAYLVNFLALLWHPLAWAARVTPFGYYTPLQPSGRIDVTNVVVLLVAAVLLIWLARWWLERRDLV